MKLYSFDVFDTLITRRTATPRGVFRIVEQRLRRSGNAKTLEKSFFEDRIRAESEARKRSRFEDVHLDEIYAVLGLLSEASEAEVTAAKALELEVEYEVSRGVPRMTE